MFPASPLQILGARGSSVSFVPKFPWEELAGLDNASSFLLSFLIRAVRTLKKKNGAWLRTPNRSLWKCSPSFRWQLYASCMCLRLVYLCVFDHDSMQHRLIPGVLWQIAGWQKALQSLKLDQSRQGLKSRHPAGRRSEETQTLARAIVRYTVAAGAHNFSLCMFFILLSSPSLIFGSEWWMTQLKVCEVLSDSDKKRHLVFVPSFSCLLGFKDGQCVCVHISTRVHVWTLLSKPTKKLWSN